MYDSGVLHRTAASPQISTSAAAPGLIATVKHQNLQGMAEREISEGSWMVAASASAAALAGSFAARKGVIRRRQRAHRVMRQHAESDMEFEQGMELSGALASIENMPVFLLSGFLGAGKTTILKNWLEKAESHVGVIVNDVASVNVDAELVKEQTTSAVGGRIDTIQLENGCVCCSSGEELIFSILDLFSLCPDDDPFSQVVVELSGIAEPARVVEKVQDLRMSPKVVTLVDASTFCLEYMEYRSLFERPDLTGEEQAHMMDTKVVELLVEQIEAADIVVLNKTDLATTAELTATKELVKALNSKASIRETSFGQITLTEVMSMAEEPTAGVAEVDDDDYEQGLLAAERAAAPLLQEKEKKRNSKTQADTEGSSGSSSDPACSDPDCHAHSHSHHTASESSDKGPTTAETRFGITSFVYRAERPFNRERLDALLKKWPVPRKDSLGTFLESAEAESEAVVSSSSSPFARVLRSKGFCWLDQQPSSKLFWGHAGKQFALSFHGVWFAAFNDQQAEFMKASRPEEYEKALQEVWSEEYGDRRQELVFIGQRLDEQAIRDVLDACLLKDDEVEAYLEKQAMDKAPPVPMTMP